MIQEESVVEIFKVVGENVERQLEKNFESNGVFLVIDPTLKSIWIWAGKKSRLFHRYIAVTWAGKVQRKNLGFKYEIIKEGQEPVAFRNSFENLKRRSSAKNPVNRREIGAHNAVEKVEVDGSRNLRNEVKSVASISKLERATLATNLSELKEIHAHFMYSLKHVEERIEQIEEILKKYDLIL